jgi:hypothetical protein
MSDHEVAERDIAPIPAHASRRSWRLTAGYSHREVRPSAAAIDFTPLVIMPKHLLSRVATESPRLSGGRSLIPLASLHGQRRLTDSFR